MKQIYKEGSHVPFSINSFTLDENRHYAIVKHLTEINKGKAAVTIRTERNYHDQIEGLPALLLKKVTMYSSYSGGKDLREESAQYSNFAKSTIPSEKMNLSHYGIPEPNFNQSPTRWPYYTFCLVALFTIGYFVFKRYAAKR